MGQAEGFYSFLSFLLLSRFLLLCPHPSLCILLFQVPVVTLVHWSLFFDTARTLAARLPRQAQSCTFLTWAQINLLRLLPTGPGHHVESLQHWRTCCISTSFLTISLLTLSCPGRTPVELLGFFSQQCLPRGYLFLNVFTYSKNSSHHR